MAGAGYGTVDGIWAAPAWAAGYASGEFGAAGAGAAGGFGARFTVVAVDEVRERAAPLDATDEAAPVFGLGALVGLGAAADDCRAAGAGGFAAYWLSWGAAAGSGGAARDVRGVGEDRGGAGVGGNNRRAPTTNARTAANAPLQIRRWDIADGRRTG